MVSIPRAEYARRRKSLMEQMEPNANQREHLYQHDMGLVRLRRHLRRMAQEQLDAMNP